jgi:hypothetical protein
VQQKLQSFEGAIIDRNGNIQTNFNGTVYPLVFDKPSRVNTIGNDAGSMVTTFLTQNNLLFKGKATVASMVVFAIYI